MCFFVRLRFWLLVFVDGDEIDWEMVAV